MTSQQTRIALSEIPDRLEALQVATTPTRMTTRLTTDDQLLGPIFGDHNTTQDNSPIGVVSQEFGIFPGASPDELVIRQRGRRRLSNWSPSKINNPTFYTASRSPFQRTPTKLPLSSGIILRSSPRKRLTMGSTPPDFSTNVPSPTKLKSNQQLLEDIYNSKKLRFDYDERPMCQINTQVALEVVLKGMSHQQLIDVIVKKIIVDDRNAETKLRELLPLPDIKLMEEELHHAKRNIFKSLPTSRLSKKNDSTAYARASVQLSEFKRILSSHTKQLHDSSNWDALLDYVSVAWPVVKSTPLWDCSTHNALRRHCFKMLSCHCIASLKHGGAHLGTDRLYRLERNLKEWAKDYEDVMYCITTLNQTFSKGRNSM